jgi:hypothetical protein
MKKCITYVKGRKIKMSPSKNEHELRRLHRLFAQVERKRRQRPTPDENAPVSH